MEKFTDRDEAKEGVILTPDEALDLICYLAQALKEGEQEIEVVTVWDDLPDDEDQAPYY